MTGNDLIRMKNSLYYHPVCLFLVSFLLNFHVYYPAIIYTGYLALPVYSCLNLNSRYFQDDQERSPVFERQPF